MFEPTQNRPNGPPTEPRDTPDLPDELGSGRRTVLRGPRTPTGASPGTGGAFFADHQEMSSPQQHTGQTIGPISKQ